MLKSNREIYKEAKRRVNAISIAAVAAKVFQYLLGFLSALAFTFAVCAIDSEGEAFQIVMYIFAFGVAMALMAYGFHLANQVLEEKVRIKRKALRQYFRYSVVRTGKERRAA